eukprot:TRINITY_DN38681_c0_g1_i2.p1 TRINITY_DN38681_c0_g1~~TRINITY_DN38681_c0_g1_i2.p1  ORF type:complete len:146 (-),score=15.21 TRINITY_DN38681_c0_g1_i2:264-701(-)
MHKWTAKFASVLGNIAMGTGLANWFEEGAQLQIKILHHTEEAKYLGELYTEEGPDPIRGTWRAASFLPTRLPARATPANAKTRRSCQRPSQSSLASSSRTCGRRDDLAPHRGRHSLLQALASLEKALLDWPRFPQQSPLPSLRSK